MGPPRRARRGDGRARLPGRRRARATRSPACRRRADDCRVFHAGTALRRQARGHQRRPRAVRHRARRLGEDGAARAPTRRSTRIRFDGMQYRSDIGHRALQARAASMTRRRAVRDYLLGLQERIVAALRGRRRRRFMRDAWTARRRSCGGGITLHPRGRRRCSSAAACNFSHVQGRNLPPSASAARPELAGRAVRGDGRVAGAPSAQSRTCPTVHMNVRFFAARGRRAGLVVRRRHGPHALLRLRGRRAPLPPHLPRCAGAVRRRPASALQELVRRVLLPASTATSRAASAASSSTTSPSRLRRASR